MDLGLAGRVVLVTGAGGGAGPTLVEAFAGEGASVAVHYRSSAARAEEAAQRIRSGGGRAIAVGADLDSSDEIGAMVGMIERELGPVAVLVTATSAYRNDAFAEIDDAAWASVVDDLLGATFRTCRAVAPGMEAAGFGRIVNVAARSGLVGVARAAHYAAAKAGIIGLTASLAKELGPKGILVNAIAPTQILTHRDGRPSIPEDRQADMAKSIPIRRLATPDDLAGLALWLGSAANTYVSGQTITLSGGAQS
ncbi:MAG TPA: SDR family NAD(P)-dependent oxidoreductase [Candidatus Limnocylindrales bacterium]|nr:SDR family NAD(P)-dependent oxidoreductase [Candidatus Limnocylindrales bacterium]